MFAANVTLYIDNTNKRIRIVDTTDLSALNLSVVGVVGSGTITSPTGDVLATGLTINRSTGATTSAWVDLDTVTSGEILNGTYSLTYEYTYTVSNYAVSSINSSNGIVLNGIDWSDLLENGNAVTISSSAITGNNGVKTVSSVAFATNTTITVSNTLTAEVTTAARISFVITTDGFFSGVYTWSGCDVKTPTVNVTFDCDSTQFGTITFADTTILPSGQTLTTREMIVAFPQLLTNPSTPANQTTSLPSITIDTLATGDWVSRLNYTVTGVQDDGLTYGYTSTSGAQTTTVTCEGSLCSMSTCIEDLINTNKQALDTTGQSAYLSAVVTITGLIAIANEQRVCGDMDAYRTTVASIRTILNNTGCDCDCCNDTEGNHWINNATFDGQNALDVLQAQIDALNLIVIPLVDELAGNAAALAAYNAILSDLNTLQSQVATLGYGVGEATAMLALLNPTSPSWAADLAALVSFINALQADIATLQTTSSGILTDIETFNTNYPSYTSYTDSMVTTLEAIDTSIDTLTTSLATLETGVGALTPSNYAANIATLQAQMATVVANVQTIQGQVTTLTAMMNGVIAAINDLASQLFALQAQVSELQTQNATQTCFPIKQAFGNIEYSDLATYGLDSFNIPAACFTDGGYVSVKVWLANGAGVNSVLNLRNETTDSLIVGLGCNALEYFVQEIFIQKTPNTNNFTVLLTTEQIVANVSENITYGSFVYTGGEIEVNTTQNFSFSDGSGTPTAGIVRLEITGYKSI